MRIASTLSLLTAAAALGPSGLGAQRTPRDSTCDYARCALAIAPVWNGLAVVRGAEQERVALLGFFRAGRLPAPLFAANDSAVRYAVRAVRVRRRASVLTDVGALFVAGGVTRAIVQHRVDAVGWGVIAGGGAAFAVSVPLQFAADAQLARAVWWRNAP